jgi:glycosyltransferase involved in cell wall biosynthesis
LKIGFLISGIGIFGSVREVVENCNVLTDLGNECYLFNPEGEKVQWLECKANVLLESKIHDYELEVLFICAQLNDHYFELIKKIKAEKKIFVFMGFNPNTDIFENNKLKYIAENYILTADGKWQLDYLKTHVPNAKIMTATLGGVNLKMFYPLPRNWNKEPIIGWSGDMRARKGGIELMNYFYSKGIDAKTYFKKNIQQNKLSDWFNGIDIFIDNHIWGGWCNPVAEAMACGVPVIVSDIPCNDFVIHQETGLRFKNVNEITGFIDQLKEPGQRVKFSVDGFQEISKYNYNKIGSDLNENLKTL